MNIGNFILENYPVLFLVSGMLILLYETHKGQDFSVAMIGSMLGILLLTVADYLERWTGTWAEPNMWRILFSVIGYTIRPLLVLGLFSMTKASKKQKRVLLGLGILNSLIYATAFFSPIAFGYGSENNFMRGPLGYTSHYITIFYILVLLYQTLHCVQLKNLREGFFLCVLVIGCILSIMVETLYSEYRVLNVCIAISYVFYYLFMYTEYSKRDILTGMMNRQSFYADYEKYENSIRALIILDMNGLKQINDTRGHLEGDTALCKVAEILEESLVAHMYGYRMGGDEFCILCSRMTEAQVIGAIERIRMNLVQKGFPCSIGYAMKTEGRTMEKLMAIADKNMYADKARYYMTHDRRKERN